MAIAHNVKSENLVVGNGATELFGQILQAFDIKEAASLIPCYSGYKETCESKKIRHILIADLDSNLPQAVFIGYPNNPTGHFPIKETIDRAISKNPATLFIIDESFIDFSIKSKTYINKNISKNVIVVKSLTKFFSIAGLRLGIATGCVENIKKIKSCQLPWSVNSIAQNIAPMLYADKEYLSISKAKTKELRDELMLKLNRIPGIKTFPSETNFILIKSDNLNLQKELLVKGFLIRSCKNIEGLGEEYYRIAVKSKKDNNLLVNALSSKKTASQ